MKIAFWKIMTFTIIGSAIVGGVVWSLFAQSDPLARHVPRDASFYLRWRKLPEMESAQALDHWMERQFMVASDWKRLVSFSHDLAYAAWTKDGQPVRVFLARGSKELLSFTHVLSPDDLRLTWSDGVVGWMTPERARGDVQELAPEAALGSMISLDISSWTLWTAMIAQDFFVIPGTEVFFSAQPQQWRFDAGEDRMIWSALQENSASISGGGAMARSMDEVLEMIPKNSRAILHGGEPGAAPFTLNTPSPILNTPPLLPDHISWSEQFRHPGTLALLPMEEPSEKKVTSDALGMIWISSEVKPEDQWKEVFESEWARVMAYKMPRRESSTLQDGSYRLDLYPSIQPALGTPITFEDQTFYKTDRGSQPFLYGVMKSRLVVVSDERLLSRMPSEPSASAARLEIFETCGRANNLPFLWMETQGSNLDHKLPFGFSLTAQQLWEARPSGEVVKVCGWTKK